VGTVKLLRGDFRQLANPIPANPISSIAHVEKYQMNFCQLPPGGSVERPKGNDLSNIPGYYSGWNFPLYNLMNQTVLQREVGVFDLDGREQFELLYFRRF